MGGEAKRWEYPSFSLTPAKYREERERASVSHCGQRRSAQAGQSRYCARLCSHPR